MLLVCVSQFFKCMKFELTEQDRVWSYVAMGDLRSTTAIEFLTDNALATMGLSAFLESVTGFRKNDRIFVTSGDFSV